MFSGLIKWAAKKYLVSMINDLLDANKEKVQKIVSKIRAFADVLTRLLKRLEDNVITKDEVNESIEDVNKLFKEMKS